MIELFGRALHEPDVVFTDVGLAILGVALGAWLRRVPRSALVTSGIVILGGQAAAAFAGAIFHGFFTQGTRTPGGYAAWLPVPLSIDIVASALLNISITSSGRAIPQSLRRGMVAVYAMAFAAVILLVNESFTTVVRFYAPVLGLFLAVSVANAWRLRSRAWTLIAISFAISALATVAQQARVAIHPVYFNHNALYHLLQGVALVILYRGIRGERDDVVESGRSSRGAAA